MKGSTQQWNKDTAAPLVLVHPAARELADAPAFADHVGPLTNPSVDEMKPSRAPSLDAVQSLSINAAVSTPALLLFAALLWFGFLKR